MGSDDYFILTFSDVPGERLSLANFVQLTTEATGAHFTADTDTEAALASTTIVLPGQVRVPKPRFLAFARFQLFLRGFGCFGDESSGFTIRPASAALVRLAFPPADACSGLDERGHAEAVDSHRPFEAERVGVVQQEKGAQDYLLVPACSGSEATLMDLAGKTLRSWKDPEATGGRWDQVLPLRDGDLLCLDSRKEVLLRLQPDGKLRWRLALAVHHQADELPDGNVLVLTRRAKLVPSIDPARRTIDSLVTLVSGDGRVLAEHSLLDMLKAGGIPLERPRALDQLPPEYDFDLLHASSLDHIDDADAAEGESPFQRGRVLVTLRNLDLVALFDLALGRCVWTSDKGRLENPHDVRRLGNGNLLVLDGLDTGGGARVIALDPLTERALWQYKSSQHGAARFAGQGTLEPRANGNVLVGLADEAFEVTRAGKLVWRHVNPPPGEPGRFGPSWSRLLPSEAALLALPADAPR
ncbi:MAG: PQQ-binding-like beta-propeller repeat protein [Planctomycetota bacterium]